MKKLEGKVAIVTGAAKGLGAGVAETYVKYGAKVCLFDLSKEVEDTAKKLQDEYHAEVITAIGDVTKKEDVEKAVQKTIDTFGELNVVCCNAGVICLLPFLEMKDEDLDYHINVNIKGVWNTCQAAIPHLLENGGGNIVIASSVTGDLVADGGETAYALTKSALVGLTKALAMEYVDRNIRVNCTQLGYSRTPMVEAIAKETNPDDPESVIQDIAKGIPMKRLAKPIEVGELFAFLGSDESSYITGGQFVIDGGATIPETNVVG